jgi:sulfatase modifying factor 1
VTRRRVPGLAIAAIAATAIAVGGAAIERLDPFPRLRFAIQRPAEDMPSTRAVDPRIVTEGLPTISLYLEPSALDELLANKMEHGREWERRASVSYFDGGRLLFSTDVGARIHGGGSRLTSPKQGFRLFFRRQYGASRVPRGLIFGPESDPLRRLVVHNDARRDGTGVVWHLVNPLAYDLSRRIGCLTSQTRPARFILNGEDQGLFVLKEHFDDEYFDAYMPGRRITMDIDDMEALRDRIDATHPLTMDAVAELIDVDNMTSWFLAVVFAGTRDAYQGPGQFLDEDKARAGWFWMTWDQDESFRDWQFDSFQYLLERVGERPRGRRRSEPRATVLTRLIAGDPAFRKYLARRIDDMLNHQLTPEFVGERISHYADVAVSFGVSPDAYLPRLREFAANRPAVVRATAEQWLNSPPSLPVAVERVGGGTLIVDGFSERSPYRGQYIPKREIAVRTPDGADLMWYVNGEATGVRSELRLTVDRPLSIGAGAPAPAAEAPPPAALPASGAVPAIVWRRVPGGEVEMGCVGAHDRACDPNEHPRERVRVAPFELAATEVTVAEFRRFATARSLMTPRQPSYSGDTHPIVNVTSAEAAAFCEAEGGRLPTEPEWEFAARAGSADTVYPWGNRYSSDAANGSGIRAADVWRHTAPVASFPANAFGLHDMIGNVWEWTSGWHREGQGWAGPTPVEPDSTSPEYLKTVRGGSWDSETASLRASRRIGLRPGDRHNLYVGFRCAR